MTSSIDELKMAVGEIRALKMFESAFMTGTLFLCMAGLGELHFLPQIFLEFLGLQGEYSPDVQFNTSWMAMITICLAAYAAYSANALQKQYKIESSLNNRTIKFTPIILMIAGSTLMYFSAAGVAQISLEISKTLFWSGFLWLMVLPTALTYYVVKDQMKSAQ